MVRKGEVFCHWVSNKDNRDHHGLVSSSSLMEDDILLIGASVRMAKLHANDKCESSPTDQRERFRNAGSLSELGTIRSARILSAETFQAQVSPPYVTLGFQREYKIRPGRSMKQALIEDWKHRPLNRQIRYLEFRLGLEVSTCTHNARRIRLIKLLGTQTMLNHLKGGLLKWTSAECHEKFYSALRDSDHTAFRKLYESSPPSWQVDFGKAIEYCLDALEDTGKNEKDLALFWAPDSDPGIKVTFKPSELSWIGFMEETQSCGTLAVLEDACLQLPTLHIGKRCQNDHFDPRHIGDGLSSPSGLFEGSILQTSVHLNETCVPASIRQGRVRSVRQNGPAPRHQYRWSLSSLEEGDKFKFGAKGSLRAITPLGKSQILAKWSPSILQSMRKSTVLGSLFDKPVERMHHECIRDQDENTRPVPFLIISTAKAMLQSPQISRRSSLHASSTLVVPEPRAYVYDPTENGQPRTTPSQSVLTQDGKDKLKEILDKWRLQPLLDSLESSLQEL